MSLLASLIVVALMVGAYAWGAWLESRTPEVCICGCQHSGYVT